MAGIVHLKSARNTLYMNENVAGVHVPDAIIKEMEGIEDRDKRARKSIEIAACIIQGSEGYLPGHSYHGAGMVAVCALGTLKGHEINEYEICNSKVFDYVVNSYCKHRRGFASCKGCRRPLCSRIPCVKY